jgi:hypothetical protein
MLFTFKSDAAGDVLMFGDVAKKLIAILGKDPADSKGIITVEQLPGAISRLRAAIDEDKARQVGGDDDEDEVVPDKTGMGAPVGLAQRAWPLLDMLEASQKEGVPVIWGT